MSSTGQPAGTPTENWVELHDIRLKYLDWGGDGQPVLALHGLASSAHWYERVAGLLSSEYRVVAPDQRGHGQTTHAPGGYDWQTLASDSVALLDHLGIERAAVLGHSWGGHVASNLAARFPHRVSRLVMIDGGFQDGHLLDDPTWEGFRRRFGPRDVSGTREDFLGRLRVQLADCWGEDLERIVMTMVYEDEQGQIRDLLRPDNHSQVLVSMWEEPPSVILPQVTCPTLIVAAGPHPDRANSEYSQMRVRMVEAASRVAPSFHVHWIPDTIHDIGYHKPRELAQAIRNFLSED